jgi:hypothetical protein
MARRVTEIGLLLRSETGLVLRRDDGGTWQLDAPRSADALVGRRVRITAWRTGFDRLSVADITPG